MKESKLHRLLEEDKSNEKQILYQKVQSKVGVMPQQKPVQKTKRKIWIYSVAVACACILCVCTLLPVFLSKESESRNRYCTSDDGGLFGVEYTLKEYAEQADKDFLYLDWYVNAEVTTYLFVNNQDENDIIYWKESLIHYETWEEVDLYITDIYTFVDNLQALRSENMNTATQKGIAVEWGYNGSMSVAIFEYKDYRYFVVLYEPEEENSILRLVDSMLA